MAFLLESIVLVVAWRDGNLNVGGAKCSVRGHRLSRIRSVLTVLSLLHNRPVTVQTPEHIVPYISKLRSFLNSLNVSLGEGILACRRVPSCGCRCHVMRLRHPSRPLPKRKLLPPIPSSRPCRDQDCDLLIRLAQRRTTVSPQFTILGTKPQQPSSLPQLRNINSSSRTPRSGQHYGLRVTPP
jgi:hypothetical protein